VEKLWKKTGEKRGKKRGKNREKFSFNLKLARILRMRAGTDFVLKYRFLSFKGLFVPGDSKSPFWAFLPKNIGLNLALQLARGPSGIKLPEKKSKNNFQPKKN